MSQVQILHRAFTLVPTDCARYEQTSPTHRTLFLRRWARYTIPTGPLVINVRWRYYWSGTVCFNLNEDNRPNSDGFPAFPHRAKAV